MILCQGDSYLYFTYRRNHQVFNNYSLIAGADIFFKWMPSLLCTAIGCLVWVGFFTKGIGFDNIVSRNYSKIKV